MEINTVPQWQGFSAATGVNVASAVIDYVMSLAQVGTTSKVIQDYYQRFGQFLPNYVAFHYWSRLWLYRRDEEAKKKLNQLTDWYLGKNDIVKRIRELTTTTAHKNDPLTERKKYYQKYPKLLKYGSLLFWWLMAREIYGEDVTVEVEKVAALEDIQKLHEALLFDREAIKILSSGATNFFYLVEAYLGKKTETIDLFNIVKSEEYKADRESLKRVFYFLSHLVIGETHFYTKKEVGDRETCLMIVKRLEEVIRNHYFKISLDMKFEFLACSQIVGYKSDLVGIIDGEAERSLSTTGNFLVDTHNAWIHGFGHKFARSEHRNVLYLMSR